MNTSRKKSCGEIAKVCLVVIASEAKQSIFPLAALWIASSQVLLAMTAVGYGATAPHCSSPLPTRATRAGEGGRVTAQNRG
jgi:hypothetical protein